MEIVVRITAVILSIFTLANVAFAQEKRVVGVLGQSIEPTEIRVNMDSKSRVLSRVQSYQYLVLNKTKFDAWYSVLLINGKTGFIKSDLVVQLPYNVEMPVRQTQQLTSRSGSNRKPSNSGSNVDSMLDYSFNFIGTPYKWGGNDLEKGIDCSGFVQQLYGGIGVNLPRTAAQQAKVGQPIERLEHLQKGDRLYFWDKKRGKIGHTGIFLGFFQDGGAYFIHSSSNNKGVDVDDLRTEKWRNMLVAARR